MELDLLEQELKSQASRLESDQHKLVLSNHNQHIAHLCLEHLEKRKSLVLDMMSNIRCGFYGSNRKGEKYVD